jgi:D-alanine transaminase
MSYVLINEKFVSREAAQVDIEDRGYQFGDGVYEVVGVYSGKFFKMDEHLVRLVRSASEIGLTLPFSVEHIKNKLLELYALDPIEDGTIYFQVSRGAAARTHFFPQPSVPAQLIAYTRPKTRPINHQKDGIACIFVEDIRWLRCDIKSLNLLGNVLAKQKAVEAGTYEAILHRGETVTEGSSNNVFIVKDNKVITHPANNYILNGITRMTVQDVCLKLNIPFVEETFSTRRFLEADEAFISGTGIEVIPVIKIDGRLIGSGEPGPVTKAIQKEFKELINKL